MFVAIDTFYTKAKGTDLEKIFNTQILGNTRVKGEQVNQAIRRYHAGQIIGWDIVPLTEQPKHGCKNKTKRNKAGAPLDRGE